MNVGQVLEVRLGWAAKGVGHRIADMLRDERTAQVRTSALTWTRSTTRPVRARASTS